VIAVIELGDEVLMAMLRRQNVNAGQQVVIRSEPPCMQQSLLTVTT